MWQHVGGGPLGQIDMREGIREKRRGGKRDTERQRQRGEKGLRAQSDTQQMLAMLLEARQKQSDTLTPCNVSPPTSHRSLHRSQTQSGKCSLRARPRGKKQVQEGKTRLRPQSSVRTQQL